MKNRILKFLSGFAAAALVVTTAIAQQPTQIQVHNINAGAVGGTWLLKPGTAPTGLHNIVFPNSQSIKRIHKRKRKTGPRKRARYTENSTRLKKALIRKDKLV